EALTRRLVARLSTSALFGRTVTVKARRHDFTTLTRSETLSHATGAAAVLLREARRLLAAVDVSTGLRLLGVGVSGLTDHAQEELELAVAERPLTIQTAFDDVAGSEEPDHLPVESVSRTALFDRRGRDWHTGMDVRHDEHG